MRCYDEALSVFQTALKLEPSSAIVLVNIGLLYSEMGDKVAAKEYYDRAIDIDDKYALAHYNLACLYSEQEEVVAAIDALRQACELSEELVNLAKEDEVFATMREHEGFQQVVCEEAKK